MAIHSISSVGGSSGGGDNLTIYIASATTPNTPSNSSYPGPNQWVVPTGWSRTPPVSVLQLWTSTGLLFGGGTQISWSVPIQYANPSSGVNSITAGGSSLQGNISLVAGTSTSLTSSGQNITINNTGVSGVGVSGQPQITGAVTLAAGANTTLTQSGNTITVASSGGGGGGGVSSVTGNIVNNTNPATPVVTQIAPDWNATSGLAVIANKPGLASDTAPGLVQTNSQSAITNAPTNFISIRLSSLPAGVSYGASAYGNGTFVAIGSGQSNSAVTSTDNGITWTTRQLPATRNWVAIAYGNGVFVAISDDQAIARSTDNGVTWIGGNLPISSAWTSIAYGNNLFVAVSTGTVAASSPDGGVTWTQRTLSTTATWNSITYGTGGFVVVGSGTACSTSPDAVNWTTRTLPATSSWSAVTNGNGLYVAVTRSNTNIAATSADGINWVQRTLPSNADWYSIAYGNNLFLTVSSSSVLASSADGITWTQQAIPTGSWNSVAFGTTSFVSISSTGGVVIALQQVSFSGINLKPTGVFSGSYTNSSISVDVYGRVTNISSGSSLTLATTGQSGPATLTGGNALIIPQYVRNPFADSNSASGISAMTSITTGIYNTASGAFSLNGTNTGQYNTGIGNAALQANSSGSYNTASGALALSNATVGNFNTSSGYNSMKLNTSGSSNTAIGAGSLYNNTTSSNSTSIGRWTGDNLPSRVVLSDGAENIAFYAKTPISGGDQTKYVLLNGRTTQWSGGALEVNGSMVFQPPTTAPALGVNLDAAIWMNSSVPTLSVRDSSGVTTQYPLGSGAATGYVRTTPYAYDSAGITIANTIGNVTLGGNGNNSIAVIGSIATYGTPQLVTQTGANGIAAGRLTTGSTLYYTAMHGVGAGGTITISESLTSGQSQTVNATTIFGNSFYNLTAVDNDGTYIWAIGASANTFIITRLAVGASSQTAVTYLRSNVFTIRDGLGSDLGDIFAFDVQPSGVANQWRLVFSGSSQLPTSQNIVYSTTLTTSASAITVSGNLTPANSGLGNGVLTLPVFLLFAPNATTTYACVGGAGHVYRYTTASGTWTQIYYNSVTGNQPQSGFFDATNNRLAFSMENGITVALDTQSLAYQQYSAIQGYTFSTVGTWGLWDDAGTLNFIINMTPSGGVVGNYLAKAVQVGAMKVNGNAIISGSIQIGSTAIPGNSVYGTNSTGNTAFVTPTSPGQALITDSNGALSWGYSGSSGLAAFVLSETTTTDGAGSFLVGTKGGAVTQTVNTLGITPPASGSGAFTVPAGLYWVTLNASVAGLPSGSVTAIMTFGTSQTVMGTGSTTSLYVSNSKIQSGSDNIASSGTMLMNLSVASNLYLAYFFGNTTGSSTGRVSSDGNCQVIFNRIS